MTKFEKIEKILKDWFGNEHFEDGELDALINEILEVKEN